ncbi:MAG TPA: NACHT domain-containing protein [Candidatus Limnocylindrales bacterium]|nr:NACHT domain-containing protein [Candidatus Limnocylindrales bacterium]
MAGGRRGSRTTWILAALWAAAIVFGVVVATNDTTGGGSLLSKALAGLGALATLVSLVRDIRPRKPDTNGTAERLENGSAAQDADRLAAAVKRAWTTEARVRRLRDPWLLPVNWGPADDNLFSVADVVFRSPKTGEIVPVDERGPSAADLSALADLYLALPNRRLVVLGSPGSGKSVAVIELTLALLDERRDGEAVPVPLQLASWNPAIDLNEWLAQQLIENYSLTSDQRRSPQAIARGLVENGLVLAVLDGLDEIHEDLWSSAIKRLNLSLDEAQPVILTCRTDDYRATVRGGTVVAKSYALELQPLDSDTARRYLTEASPGGDASVAWAEVFGRVRAEPAGPLAETMRSPLMVSMAREIYCDSPHDPRDLLDGRFDSQDALELHLLSKLVPATYQQERTIRPALARWPDRRPEAWLRYLAVRGSGPGNPNVAWWQVEKGLSPLVTGALPVAVATALIALLVGPWPAAGFAITALAAAGTWHGRQWTLEAALIHWPRGGTAEPPDPLHRERAARWAALTTGRLIAAGAGVAYGYILYPDFTLQHTAALAVLLGLAVGLADGFFTISLRTVPTTMRIASYRGVTAFLRRFLIYLVMAVPSTVTMWVLFHSRYAMLVVAVAFVLFGLIDGVNVWLDVPADVTRALSPRSTRRDERFAAFARSLTVAVTLSGVTVALYGVAGRMSEGVMPALVVGLGYGLADRLMGLATSVWGRYIVAKAWLAIRGDLPWRLMRFLDDAHRRGVLRRAGAVYQFRHARLQDHLANGGQT